MRTALLTSSQPKLQASFQDTRFCYHPAAKFQRLLCPYSSQQRTRSHPHTSAQNSLVPSSKSSTEEKELSAALADLSKAQENSSDSEVCDAKEIQVLVETAMFAAMGGLAFSVAAVLKLQGYMGYLLPMPIVLSALRSGPAVARKTAVATAFLLFVLMGPLQAISYLLQHGCTAWALGTGWHFRFPWWLSILAASLVRMLGTIGFLAFTSWTLNENLYRLLVTQIHALVEQLTVMMKIAGSPSPLTIQVFMGASLLVNCLMYIALLHVMYAIFLSSMGYRAVELPAFVQKRIMPHK